VHQYLCSFDVLPELIPEPVPFMSALDQAWDVGNYEGSEVFQGHHAQVRRKRRKRVIGDFGPGGADAGNQRGFAHVWKPHESYVGDRFRAGGELDLLTRSSGFRVPGSRVRGVVEVRVAAAAPLPLRQAYP